MSTSGYVLPADKRTVMPTAKTLSSRDLLVKVKQLLARKPGC